MSEEIFHPTEEGTPQGGIASPTLANIALDQLEKLVLSMAEKGDKIHFIRYADDFICTANSKEILENKVQPAIISFLKERGLELSLEKTKITHINDGFDFLGFNIRKYNNKLLIKPSASSVKKFSESIRETIKKLGNSITAKLIASLNSKIRGWTNYYRSSVAKEIFNDIDKVVFDSLWRMLKKKASKQKHPLGPKQVLHENRTEKLVFFLQSQNEKGNKDLHPSKCNRYDNSEAYQN